MALMHRIAVAVTEQSQVSEARRAAVAMAEELGFSKSRAGTVAIAATEVATNLVKHGGGGSIVVQSMIQNGLRGIELFALDRGGGISNIAASLRDGHSTAGTAGIGLGALSRLCSSFDVYSQPAAGTAVRCVVWSGEAPVLDTDLESGVICIPLKGETACGDDWNLHASKGRYVLLVVDGLGHGPEAAAAALAAKDIAERNAQRTPAEQIDAIHAGLRATRGAAAAVVELKPWSEVGTFCGIGNISCFVRVDGKTRNLASHNGILGHQVRKVQEFSFPFPRNALLYTFSDGMNSRWDPGAYPGLENRPAALIAGVVYRDHARGRDDTTLAVLRNIRSGKA
jgi:anti-sigma regulatory factor (Ser/Thr protein kinase)